MKRCVARQTRQTLHLLAVRSRPVAGGVGTWPLLTSGGSGWGRSTAAGDTSEVTWRCSEGVWSGGWAGVAAGLGHRTWGGARRCGCSRVRQGLGCRMRCRGVRGAVGHGGCSCSVMCHVVREAEGHQRGSCSAIWWGISGLGGWALEGWLPYPSACEPNQVIFVGPSFDGGTISAPFPCSMVLDCYWVPHS